MVRTVVVALCLLVSACDGAPDEEDVRPALIEAIRGDLATVTLGLPGGRSLRPEDVSVANIEILNATDIGDAWSLRVTFDFVVAGTPHPQRVDVRMRETGGAWEVFQIDRRH